MWHYNHKGPHSAPVRCARGLSSNFAQMKIWSPRFAEVQMEIRVADSSERVHVSRRNLQHLTASVFTYRLSFIHLFESWENVFLR